VLAVGGADWPIPGRYADRGDRAGPRSAAHRGERVVGELDQMEEVDHDRRVRQQPGRADRRGVGGRGIDRDVGDALAELLSAFG